MFTEKDAISGVVRPVAARWDVPMGVLRGFASESFTWLAANYIRSWIHAGRSIYVYQLGDHDPSGVSAWEVFARGIRGFLGDDAENVTFERLAVLPSQIERWGLPTRPTKASDPKSCQVRRRVRRGGCDTRRPAPLTSWRMPSSGTSTRKHCGSPGSPSDPNATFSPG